MPRGRPVDPALCARAVKMAQAGRGRNDIARSLGISAASVSKIASDAGVSFDRSATAVAVQVEVVNRAVRRGKIVDRLYARAEKILTRLEADTFTYRVPVPGMGAEHVVDDDPPARDEKDLATALGGYLTQAVKLEQVDADQGASKAGSLLAALAEGFTEAARLLDDVVDQADADPDVPEFVQPVDPE